MSILKFEVSVDTANSAEVAAVLAFISELKEVSGTTTTVKEKRSTGSTKATEKVIPKVEDSKPETVETPVENTMDKSTEATETPATPTPTGSNAMDDIRLEMPKKLEKNRPAIKAKLVELGAPGGISTLPIANHQEFLDFLLTLEG